VALLRCGAVALSSEDELKHQVQEGSSWLEANVSARTCRSSPAICSGGSAATSHAPPAPWSADTLVVRAVVDGLARPATGETAFEPGRSRDLLSARRCRRRWVRRHWMTWGGPTLAGRCEGRGRSLPPRAGVPGRRAVPLQRGHPATVRGELLSRQRSREEPRGRPGGVGRATWAGPDRVRADVVRPRRSGPIGPGGARPAGTSVRAAPGRLRRRSRARDPRRALGSVVGPPLDPGSCRPKGTRIRWTGFCNPGDLGTWGPGDLGTWGPGDLGTWGPGDLGTWGPGDLGARARGDVGTRQDTSRHARDARRFGGGCSEVCIVLSRHPKGSAERSSAGLKWDRLPSPRVAL